MIGLHAIRVQPRVKLTDDQLIALGNALIDGYEVRIRLHTSERTIVQYNPWGIWATAGYPWYLSYGQRNTRRKKAQAALEAERIHISRPSEER